MLAVADDVLAAEYDIWFKSVVKGDVSSGSFECVGAVSDDEASDDAAASAVVEGE